MKKEILNKLHKTQVEILDEIVKICRKNEINYFLIGGTLLGAKRHKGFIPWDDDLDIAMPRKDYEKFLKIAKQEINNDRFIIDDCKGNKKYWQPFAKVRMKNTIYQERFVKESEIENGIWVDIFPLDNTKKENSSTLKLQWKIILSLRKLTLNKVNSKEKNIFKTILALITNANLNARLTTIIMKMQNKGESKYFMNFGSQYGIKKQVHPKDKYLPAKELEFEGKRYNVPNDYEYVLKKIYGNNYMELPPEEKRVTHNPMKIKFEDGEEYKFEQ